MYERIIKEMSIAGYGDWNPSKHLIGTRGATVVKLKWVLIDTFITKCGMELELRTLKNEYMVGRFVTTFTNDLIFEQFLHMKMSEQSDIAEAFGITSKLLNVDGVMVDDSSQGDGIAALTYSSIVKNQDVVIISDEVQFFGARKLWSRLSKQKDVRVHIIDIDSETYLEKNAQIYQGDDDSDFDKRIWCRDFDNKYIRLILEYYKA